jgi:hypothetical protein
MTATTDRPVLTLSDLEAHDPWARPGGREQRFLCPLPPCAGHQRIPEHRSISVNLDSGAWTCYRCGAGGVLKEHWEPRGRQDRGRAALTRAFTLRPQTTPPPSSSPDPDPTAWDWRVEWEAAQLLAGTPGAAYLEGRGLPVEIAEAAGVRYTDRWAGRPAVLYPICDRGGELVAVNGRYIDGRTDPKTRTGGPRKLGAFCTPGALVADPLIICEGPFDALAFAVVGLPALAPVGTDLPAWLPTMVLGRRVVLAHDVDGAGDEAAAKHTPQLTSLGGQVERWRPPEQLNDWGAVLQQQGPDGIWDALLMEPSQPLPDRSPEAAALRSQILAWLDRRWDPETSWPAVHLLVEAGARPWRVFFETANVDQLRRCLTLIRQEDALLGDESPWRTHQP